MIQFEDVLNKASSEMCNVIDEELGINRDRLKHNMQLFEKWIRGQDHLPKDCENHLLENFIRLSKNDLEKSKRKFEASVVSRSKFSYIYANRSVTEDTFSKTQPHAYFCVPPGFTPDGYRIVITQFKPDFADFDFKECLKYVAMIGDVLLAKDVFAGNVVIVDFEHFSLSHLSKMNVFDIKKALYLVQNAYPNRIKRIHLINARPLVESLATVVKPMLTEKLRKRLMLHKNVQDLFQYVRIELLPKDYGGAEKSSYEIAESWKGFFTEDVDWRRKIDRMKLIGDIPKHRLDLYSFQEFSMEGSFRQLNID